MFLDQNIPNTFRYVAELHDNYVILVKEQTLRSGTNYEAYIQFFSPSTQVEHITNYKITDGDEKQYNYHYINNQYYSYIDNMTVSYTKHTYELDNITNSMWERPDIWSISVLVALLLGLVIIIVNLATSLIHRGGIFHA